MFFCVFSQTIRKYYVDFFRFICYNTAALTENAAHLTLQTIKRNHTAVNKNHEMSTKMFADRHFNSELWRLAFPIALQNLMLALVAAADALMLGNIDQNSMSAVSLATQIQFVQNMMLSSAVSAISILGAQYWGKGDKETVKDVLCIGLRFCGLISVIFFTGCVFFPGQLMFLFTDEPELIEIGIGYLRIAGWSYLLTGISQCYLCVLKVSDHPSQAAAISSVTVILNIVLNAVFIYGLAGVPAFGARGAAIATLTARIVELIWSVGISFAPSYLHPSFAAFFRHRVQLFMDFMKVAVPILGAAMLWGVGFTAYSAFMGHLGTDAAAANSVASVVRDLVCCLCNGISAGGGIMVGNELGKGSLDTGKVYGIRLAKISFLFGFISTFIMLAITPALLTFVKLTEGASDYLLGMMIIMSFYMIGRVVNTIVINGIFAAGGDTMFDLYSLIVCMWCLAVPLAALGTFAFHWNPLVVYAMTCLDEVGKIPWVMFHFRKYKWVRDLTRDNADAV